MLFITRFHLLLFSSTATLFYTSFFDCIEFPDESLWLSPDLTESCESERYAGIKAYVVCCLLVYPVGIPLGFFALLRRHRVAILATGHHALPAGDGERDNNSSGGFDGGFGAGAATAGGGEEELPVQLRPLRFLFEDFSRTTESSIYGECYRSLMRVMLGGFVLVLGEVRTLSCQGKGLGAPYSSTLPPVPLVTSPLVSLPRSRAPTFFTPR